jgi:hypothetical protein
MAQNLRMLLRRFAGERRARNARGNMTRDIRDVYKRGRPPIAHDEPVEVINDEKPATSQTDWEILAQQTIDERRKERRVNLRFPVQVSGFSNDGKLFCKNTFTTDISATGCRVELEELVERGDTIGIRLLVNASPDAPVSKPQMFQILWRARRENIWMVGALKLSEDKFWHVEFPEKSPFKAS